MLCPDALPSPLWVLGTGTGVGKTQVAARLARAWAGLGPVAYRKPFQTGVDRAEHPEADAAAVRGPGIITESHILLKAPLAPLAAARLDGRSLDLEAAARWCQRPFEGRVVLEGVGGLMVPLAPRTHFLAWATDLKIPCVLVALVGLGTLNHTLHCCVHDFIHLGGGGDLRLLFRVPRHARARSATHQRAQAFRFVSGA